MDDDFARVGRVLCYTQGSLETDPCKACESLEENPFGGCYTLLLHFNNTCACCLFARNSASCNKTEPGGCYSSSTEPGAKKRTGKI